MKVLISGGGTGGHIYPAISIANALRETDSTTELLFVGALGRMEMERVPAEGYRIIGLPVAGFDRKRLWRNVAVVAKLMRSMLMARKIIRDFAPDVAVGVGGYASGPMLKAAQRAGIPTLIQEQNSYAGVTNRLLAAKASAICVAYKGMERFFPADRIMLTGNPVRRAIISRNISREDAKRQLGFNPNRPLVAVLGGSLGARTVNEAMKKCVGRLLDTGASVLWQTGKNYYEDCHMATAALAETPDLNITPFVSRMDLVYAGADLMVSRAGASTISEIQLAGVPAVLIPSPNVAEDHQRHNAEALVRDGAAVMLPDKDAVERLGDTVVELLSKPENLASLGRNARKMALTGSAATIARKITELARK